VYNVVNNPISGMDMMAYDSVGIGDMSLSSPLQSFRWPFHRGVNSTPTNKKNWARSANTQHKRMKLWELINDDIETAPDHVRKL